MVDSVLPSVQLTALCVSLRPGVLRMCSRRLQGRHLRPWDIELEYRPF